MTPFLQGTTRPTVDPALVWPFAHNWRSQASERLEWKTSIHTAHSGDEMRRSWRREPRLLAGFESQVVGQQAARAQAMLRGWAGKTWAVPIWWAASRLTLAAGSTLTLSRATDTLWPASGWGLLWRADDDCEIFEIDTVQADSLTPTAEPTGAWAAGDLVVPLHFATLDDAQSWSAVTGGVAVVKTDWSVLPGNGTVLREPENGDYWTDMMAGATDTRGQLLLRRHDWSTEVSVTAETLTDIFDPGIGLLNRRPARSRPSLQWSVRDFLETDAALAQFRKFCAAHRGPAVGFHSACPVVDVTLLGIVGTAATLSGALDIIDDLAGTFTGLVFCDDAGIHTCQVTAFPSATAATLSAAVTVEGGVQWARLVSKARLAADAVEITHHALGLGVASYAVRTLPAASEDATVGYYFTFTQGATNSANGGNVTPVYVQWPSPPIAAAGVRITVSSTHPSGLYRFADSWIGAGNPIQTGFTGAGLTTTSMVLGLPFGDLGPIHGTLQFVNSEGAPFGPVYTEPPSGGG